MNKENYQPRLKPFMEMVPEASVPLIRKFGDGNYPAIRVGSLGSVSIGIYSEEKGYQKHISITDHVSTNLSPEGILKIEAKAFGSLEEQIILIKEDKIIKK